MDREREIAAKNTPNSGVSFVFQEQNFPDPRLEFCSNVSQVIRKIWGYLPGKVGGEFMCNSQQISLASGSY